VYKRKEKGKLETELFAFKMEHKEEKG